MTINWSKALGQNLIMFPGPCELPLAVNTALTRPPLAYYEPSFSEQVIEPLCSELQRTFQTERNNVVVLPGSGRTGIEASVLSTIEPGEKVIVITSGLFGGLLNEIVRRSGAALTTFQVPLGQPLNLEELTREVERVQPAMIAMVHCESSTGSTYPAEEVGRLAHQHGALFLLDTISSLGGTEVKTDAWGVDLNISAPQKCLGAPMGLSFVAISARAWEKMAARKQPCWSWTMDLLRWRDGWIAQSRGGKRPDNAPPHIPVGLASQTIEATVVAMNLLAQEGGLGNRISRHAITAKAIRAAVRGMGLEMFPEASVQSDTVSCIFTPAGIAPGDLVRGVFERFGIQIAPSFGKIGNTTFRIATMGPTAHPRFVLPTLAAIETTLSALGAKCELGAGLASAQKVFSEATLR